MSSRIISAFLALGVLFAPLSAVAQNAQATLTGRILDISEGLAVPGALVELERGDAVVAKTTTDANGTFTFARQAPGEYGLVVAAAGYDTTRVPTVYLIAGQNVQVQTALIRSSTNAGGNPKTIARTVVAARNSLQTSTTINRSVNPTLVQDFATLRAADILGTLPGVNINHTTSSVGDDVNISIRGFDPSEATTLLDGHPIGAQGAFNSFGGFNYKVSPFWGISNVNVIYGSGAAGLYGISTIAGAVNFETLNPTLKPAALLQQGTGNNGHAMSAFDATGTLGKLGYAFASATQGTDGQFYPAPRQQQANLAVSGYTDPNGVNAPSISPLNVAANTYLVGGGYTQRNNLGKIVYQFSPHTQLLASVADWTTWNDKTGEGDNDNISYAYAYAHAPVGQNFVLPNGTSTACSSSTIAVITASTGTPGNETPTAYTCMDRSTYASTFNGPAGGGIGRWNASHLQDYHARVTQDFGKTQFIVDGFVDNFGSDEHKSPTGPFYEDTYLTHGYLLSDEFSLGTKNDVTLGYFGQTQRHDTANTYVPTGTYYLTTSSYFVRDAYTPSLKLSIFGDLWLQHSRNTGQNNFDPRLSFVYRPSGKDVVRVTAGRAYSEPDPQLVNAVTAGLGAPNSLNPICYPGALNSVGTVPNKGLKTESAVDEELSYGHRFNADTVVQFDLYNANEQNPILSGLEPLSAYPAGVALLTAVDPNTGLTYQQEFLNRVQGQCGGSPSPSVLGWSTNLNAGSAIYRGIDVNATTRVMRNVSVALEYGVQSAFYQNIPVTILQSNANLINGHQLSQAPLQKGNVMVTYANPAGFKTIVQGVFTGSNNWLNRGPFWYANANVSKTTGPVTVSLGVENLFNSVASDYGYIGLGQFQGQNQFGGATNALQAGTELFGMPYRQFLLNVTFKV